MDILLYIFAENIYVCVYLYVYILILSKLSQYIFLLSISVVQFFENVSPFFSSNILSSPLLFNLFSLSATCCTHVKHMILPRGPQVHSSFCALPSG